MLINSGWLMLFSLCRISIQQHKWMSVRWIHVKSFAHKSQIQHALNLKLLMIFRRSDLCNKCTFITLFTSLFLICSFIYEQVQSPVSFMACIYNWHGNYLWFWSMQIGQFTNTNSVQLKHHEIIILCLSQICCYDSK